MKTYTDEQKAQALELYQTQGSRPASRALGIGESTIRRWAMQAGVRGLVNEQTAAATETARIRAASLREQTRLRILDQARRLLERICEPHVEHKVLADGRIVDVPMNAPPAKDTRDLAVAFGILVDKYRLESGEHTDRSRSDVNVSAVPEEQLDRDIARIVGQLRVVPGGASHSG